MEYRSSYVMAYILKYCRDHSITANKTKVQKLLYCCYGVFLAKFDERLTDEHPKAWMYGPVYPRTFNDINKGRLTVGMANQFEQDCEPEKLCVINKTIEVFGKYSAGALSDWSHLPGSPCSKADSLASLDDREIGIYFKPYLEVIENEQTC